MGRRFAFWVPQNKHLGFFYPQITTPTQTYQLVVSTSAAPKKKESLSSWPGANLIHFFTWSSDLKNVCQVKRGSFSPILSGWTFKQKIFNMNMKKQPLENVSPSKFCDFPLPCEFSGCKISSFCLGHSSSWIVFHYDLEPGPNVWALPSWNMDA